jgi:hypothetical protein
MLLIRFVILKIVSMRLFVFAQIAALCVANIAVSGQLPSKGTEIATAQSRFPPGSTVSMYGMFSANQALVDLQERPLWNDNNQEFVLRILLLRYHESPICIIVERDPSGLTRAKVKRNDGIYGAGYVNPKTGPSVKQVPMDIRSVTMLKGMMNKADFFNIPRQSANLANTGLEEMKTTPGILPSQSKFQHDLSKSLYQLVREKVENNDNLSDGRSPFEWVFEANDRGKYHVVDRIDYCEKDLYSIADFLFKKARIADLDLMTTEK